MKFLSDSQSTQSSKLLSANTLSYCSYIWPMNKTVVRA